MSPSTSTADALLGIFGFRRVTPCRHDWRPRSTFLRCHTCGGIGVIEGGVVVPYVCTVRGCGQLAVSRSRGTGQLCRGHQ